MARARGYGLGFNSFCEAMFDITLGAHVAQTSMEASRGIAGYSMQSFPKVASHSGQGGCFQFMLIHVGIYSDGSLCRFALAG